MRLVKTKSLRVISLLFVITVAATLSARAQTVRLQLGELDKLEARAAESVDVTLDGALLELAVRFLNNKKPEEAAIKELVMGIKGVYVKVFEFDKEGEYSLSDVESVRTQLRAPGWSRMVGVKSKREGENVEVYMTMEGQQIGGIAVIATEPKQLTVVNIIGSIDLDKLRRLSGRFGIPSLDISLGGDNKNPKE
ncbi:MAG TPA: DUF4252 domain-containing protein [Pyrinomonadaceae bacterium]|nr:DUF4252 domain-containing protein [Pyrinomonadaceae bacterium]